MFSTQNHFNILSDLSIALLFHRIICLSASICLFVFFSVYFDVVSLKGQKRCHCIFIPVWYQQKMFISLCLSLHACLLCLRGWCLCMLCVFVCLSLLFLIRSHQSVARWELSLSTYCLLIPLSLFPTCETQNISLVNLSKQTLSPSIPRCLGYDLDSLPFSSLPFKKNNNPVPILGQSDEKTILGTPPHSFQKTNT